MHEYKITRLIEGVLHLNATLEACFARVDGFEEGKECLGRCELRFLFLFLSRSVGEEGGMRCDGLRWGWGWRRVESVADRLFDLDLRQVGLGLLGD